MLEWNKTILKGNIAKGILMINKIIEIVKEASKLMLTDVTITQKGSHSDFVTSADVNVQHYLEEH